MIESSSQDPESIRIGRVRLGQVFDYLQALDQLRNPVRRSVEEQPWHYWLHDLPSHPLIRRGTVQDSAANDDAGDDFILRIRRPPITYGPKPPAVLEDWVVIADRSNTESTIEVRQTLNRRGPNGDAITVRFDEEPDRVEAFRDWREYWEQWADAERPARGVLKVFEQMYTLHGQLERDGERLELVVGDGILHWRRPELRIHHPLLLRRLQLEFAPEVPEFILRETDHPVELYSAVFRGIDDVDGAALAKSQEEMEAALLHPLGGPATSNFLRKLVARLSALGQFLEDAASSHGAVEPEIHRDPVLFLRSRTLGFASALQAVQEDLQSRVELPVSLLNIMGIEAPPPCEEAESDWFGIANEVEDVLLSKPANPEQVQIARQLKKHGAVLVQGPPGTGKTHTIANLVGHLLAQGKSVLVTSHTAKALRVLHEKLVEQLQPLCVTVLGRDAENRAGLEKAVTGIVERLSTSVDQLEAESRRLQAERGSLIQSLASSRKALLDCISGEYRDLVVAGEAFTPSAAARIVSKHAQTDSWIPGPIKAGAPLPLSPSEIKELYSTNTAVSDEDEHEIDSGLPTPDTLPSPGTFGQLVLEEAELEAGDLTTGSRLWREAPPEPDVEILEQLQLKVEAVLEMLGSGDDWKIAIVQAGQQGGAHRRVWDDLMQVVMDWAQEGAECERLIAEFGPELPEDADVLSQERILDEILAHVAKGGRLDSKALFIHRNWKRLLAGATVGGRSPSQPEHFSALRSLVRIRRGRGELRARWDRQVQPIGGPAARELGERPEQSAVRLAEVVLGCLDWHAQVWDPIEARLVAHGFDWQTALQQVTPNLGAYGDLVRLRDCVSEHLLPAIRSRVAATRLHALKAQFTALGEQLLRVTARCDSSLIPRLERAVAGRDVPSYSDAFEQLVKLHGRASTIDRRRTLLRTLEAAAPTWADQVRLRSDRHGSAVPPGDVEAAWLWRQLVQELDLRAAVSAVELQRQIEQLTHQLQTVTTELIDRRAWAAQIHRVGVPQRQALVGWLQTVKKIGAATGKRAPLLMAEARRQMAACVNAVPVWVMPLTRVVENFDPRSTRFDVVIIDEASQSDIMALIALYLGEQVLVVGDEEQVSPDAVGQNLTAVGQLIAQYLRDVPNGHLYDGQTSVYDLAKASFGGTICLREHFRCVPEIIQFSNALSYDGRLKPLRDGSDARAKPPLIAHRVEGSKTGNNVNPEEAIAIATLIASAIEQPEYESASFGVISMVGEQQAIEVDRLLRTHLSPIELERRRIMCGNSAQFQGDERDVMLLSVVDSPSGGPLSLRSQPMFKKRFNVAASRARNQMWVVHSLSPSVDLKPGDLRRRLIEHALYPGALMQQLEQVNSRVESEFERQVAQRLVNAGFQVVPQWRVGYYRIDLVVVKGERRLAIECDGDRYHPLEKLPEDMERQAILERLGWKFERVRGSEYFRDPDRAMDPVFEMLDTLGITPQDLEVQAASPLGDELRERVVRRAAEIRREWEEEPYGSPVTGSHTEPARSLPDNDEEARRSEDSMEARAGSSPKLSEPLASGLANGSLVPQVSQSREGNLSLNTDPPDIQRSISEPMEHFQMTLPSSGTSKADLNAPLDLPAFFRSRGIVYNDKRDRPGGSFWVTGGQELRGLMDELEGRDFHFRFTSNGSRATRYQPGWFFRPSSSE